MTELPNSDVTLTPFKKQDIIDQLIELSRGKESRDGVFSDAIAMHFQPGKRVKSFVMKDRESFDKTEKAYAKNSLTRINKKREGAFFPHVHLIENKHVEEVLERLQIYKKGVVPEAPDVCSY